MKSLYTIFPKTVKADEDNLGENQSIRNIYPEILPKSLRKLPDLLKGKVSDAAEMFLAARCDYEGALACEMAAHLLDEEMTSQDTPYSFDERMAIYHNRYEIDDWSMEVDRAYLKDPVIREKLEFVISLVCAHVQRKGNDFWEYYMTSAVHCASHLASIYRERLEAQETAASEAACVGEGA